MSSKKLRAKALISFCMAATIMAMSTGCVPMAKNDKAATGNNSTFDESVLAPDAKYPELVTYTLGKNTPSSPRLPEGDTYENNAYTRYLKEKFNIQNSNMFEAPNGDAYGQKISMSMVAGEIPDIMIVNNYNELRQLVDNDLIEDLTAVYEKTASPVIKEIYNSYDGKCLEGATIDGKLMALPGTRINIKPNTTWLRKDWMDKLGLEAPKSMDDLENIIKQFMEKDPGGNGAGKTVGLICGTGVGELEPYYSAYGAYMNQWIKDKDGKVVYGSTTPEMRKGLEKAADLYKQGILDKEFPTKTYDDNIGTIVNGQCGAYFGYWFSPDYPFIDGKKLNPEMEWEPYIIPTNADGSINTYSDNPCDKFVVVRKGYEHPEIAMKMVNGLFDYTNFDPLASEIKEYKQNNVDDGVSPLDMAIGYKDTVYRMYLAINDVVSNGKEASALSVSNAGSYENSMAYMASIEKGETPTPSNWASYKSRMVGAKLFGEAKVNVVDPVFFGTTKTMKLKDASLKKMQEETFLKIVIGEQPIEAFDTFVANWKKSGGDEITREVEEEI